MLDLTGHKITDRKRGATLQVRLRLKVEKPRRIGRARLTLRRIQQVTLNHFFGRQIGDATKLKY
jgi:hypothetical protein